MIDLSFSEMLLVAVIAVVVIGPKDLPRVMSQVGKWVGQGKAMARQFRHGLDEMVRESELKDMEKRWADHNQRIMAEHPEALDEDNPTEGEKPRDEMKPLASPIDAPFDHTRSDDAPELPLDPPDKSRDGAP